MNGGDREPPAPREGRPNTLGNAVEPARLPSVPTTFPRLAQAFDGPDGLRDLGRPIGATFRGEFLSRWDKNPTSLGRTARPGR